MPELKNERVDLRPDRVLWVLGAHRMHQRRLDKTGTPDTARRATRVPQEAVSNGQLRVTRDHGWPQVRARTMAALQSCPALDQTHVPSAGLGSGMSSGPGVRVVGHQGAGILSRRRRRLRGGLADATGYRFRPVRPAASKHTRVPLPPVNHGQ
jgi:hypothetical protein